MTRILLSNRRHEMKRIRQGYHKQVVRRMIPSIRCISAHPGSHLSVMAIKLSLEDHATSRSALTTVLITANNKFVQGAIDGCIGTDPVRHSNLSVIHAADLVISLWSVERNASMPSKIPILTIRKSKLKKNR